MGRFLGRRRWRLVVLVVAGLGVAGGVAYATIPGGDNTYTGCMLKNVGTVRLIDPTLPSGNLMSHCTALETQISWNQQGQKGDPGTPGLPGPNGAAGANGISPTVAQLPVGDSNCPNGGAAITDAWHSTAYVCSGQNGTDGQSFAGSFTSPNGLFSLTVANSGIDLKGPNATISLPQAPTLGVRINSTGELFLHANDLATEATHDETIYVAHDLTESVDHDATTHISHDRTETVDGNQGVTIHGSRSETVDTNESIMIGGSRTESVGGSDGVTVGGNRSENVNGGETINIAGSRNQTVRLNDTLHVLTNHSEMIDGSLSVNVAGPVDLRGSMVAINGGGSNCQPVARQGDFVSAAGVILAGSATVCVGS